MSEHAYDGPPLMLVHPKRLRREAIDNLRETFAAGLATGKPMVIDDGFEVYQLIEGRWQPLRQGEPDIPPEDAARLVTEQKAVATVAAEYKIPADKLRA